MAASGSNTPSTTTGTLQPPETKAPKRVAKFTGNDFVVRRITAKHFKEAGIDGMKDQEWSRDNRHSVDASDWPQEAVDLVAAQANFKIVEG